jgi:hypothetical protein
MAKSKYILDLSYPADLFFAFDHGAADHPDARIVKVAGYSGASGMGFGERDHSWYDLTEARAVKLKGELRALKIKGCRVNYRPDDED